LTINSPKKLQLKMTKINKLVVIFWGGDGMRKRGRKKKKIKNKRMKNKRKKPTWKRRRRLQGGGAISLVSK